MGKLLRSYGIPTIQQITSGTLGKIVIDGLAANVADDRR